MSQSLAVLAALVVGILALVSLGILFLFAHSIDWKLWPAIRRTKRQVKEIVDQHVAGARVFSTQGATRIDPRYLTIWIATNTDDERNRLRKEPKLYEQFCEALVRAGYPKESIPIVGLVVESQETVDRDFGGRWTEATEMPLLRGLEGDLLTTDSKSVCPRPTTTLYEVISMNHGRCMVLFIACFLAVISMASATDDVLTGGLQAIAGTEAVNCGDVLSGAASKEADKCVQRSFKNRKPFYVKYDHRGVDTHAEYGLAGNAHGDVSMVIFDKAANQNTVMPCLKPIRFRTNSSGLTCPYNDPRTH